MIYCWLIYFFVIGINLIGLLFFYDPLNMLFKRFEYNPSLLYLAHLTVIISTLLWFYLRLKFKEKQNPHPQKKSQFQNPEFVLKSLVLIQLIFLFLLFTVFDGYSVLTQEIYRGEWRSQFGIFGPIVTTLTKFLIPGNFVYFSLIFTEKPFSQNSAKIKFYLFLMIFITFLAGLCLGGKTSAVYLLLGGAFVLFHYFKLNFKTIAILVGINICVYFLSSFYFDGNKSISEAVDNGLSRFTYVQAEPIGIIYQKVVENDPELTPYTHTLLGFLGNQGVSYLLDIGKNSVEMNQYNFSRMTTYLTYPQNLEQIRKDEYNITASVFIEGILALGRIGFIFFSALNALIAAYLLFSIGRIFNRTLSYAISSTILIYFLFVFIPWTNSGGVTILFHIVTVFSIISMMVYFTLFEWCMARNEQLKDVSFKASSRTQTLV